MPHCVLEYARPALHDTDLPSLLPEIHDIVAQSELFAPANIKCRAIPVDHYLISGEIKLFVHLSVRILPGRTNEQKTGLSTNLHTLLKDRLPGVPSISVEVIDIHKESYARG